LKNATLPLTLTTFISLIAIAVGCRSITERQDVRPLVLRDVPAQRLAYRFEPDTGAPAEIQNSDAIEKLAPVLTDFETRRPDDALIRTVTSPDGQRALALYSTEEDSRQAFRIDIYAADGKFLRNLTPPTLSCVFPETVAWSTDANFITFIARKNVQPAPSPSPIPPNEDTTSPDSVPAPSPSVAPAFPTVQVFTTEQIYICNRDGFDLKPLTTRDGLIYFYLSWAPDSHALVAMACKEDEWDAREKASKLPAGRPRLITIDGKERLLDDHLTECLPVWSPDSSKVATAFETDVAIYDAATNKPTQARLSLRDQLLNASFAYEEKNSNKKKEESGQHKGAAAGASGQATSGTQAQSTSGTQGQVTSASQGVPASFNPIVRIEWPSPETIYLQTAYVRVYTNETINTFQRWHRLSLSPQAAVLR
jgi:hypothetical protein